MVMGSLNNLSKPCWNFSDIKKREFGFVYSGSFKRKIQFADVDKLKNFILMVKPLDSFVSVARYEEPKTMDGWVGSDLFFDFDSSVGMPVSVYTDVMVALRVLKNDFAFKNIIVNKSGNKGYHIIVSDDIVQDLSAGERLEIADYLTIKYKTKSLDVPCTVDIHRLRRLEGTKNSKSGNFCVRLETFK